MRIKGSLLASVLLLCLGLASLFSTISPPAVDAADSQMVYWIPVEQEVERGLLRFLERGFQEAQEAGADEIVLEMDTLGGEVNAALDIGKLLRASEIPVTVYIKGEAISAGAYIALNADHILMTPGSAMGAAAPVTITGEEADPKTVAFWRSNMQAAAEAQGRDPEIAGGMVDRNVEIEGIKEKGELISLSAQQAVKLEMADKLVANEQEVLRFLKAEDAEVVHTDLTVSERIARFVTSPYVIPVLFTIGLAGIAIELFSPGFGIPGTIGLGAFVLYFFGHFLAGFAGYETLVLFVIGLILLAIEIFVAGFGLFGILGLIALVASLITAAPNVIFGLISLLIAMAVTTVGVYLAIRRLGTRGVWKRLVLLDNQRNESGYISQANRSTLTGKKGKTVTPLRPSGTAMIDGVRQDVVSDGGFIPVHTPVEVVGAEGGRLVVRQVKNPPPVSAADDSVNHKSIKED
ncbi:NfeD family protein [Desmospora activa]|uniref:Membrane-bound serine protease (ClpP class) n=1 Tax=Desmospora activa DSM 45169 TaxID=1121389 RepID=A0A2T4ZC71_9BACL|nr:nodulation protein NfeD [Desmospora activa]PTM59484.1 membrane-bound serine protease (ClpP class) [Desmospora activa DSM 45169]